MLSYVQLNNGPTASIGIGTKHISSYYDLRLPDPIDYGVREHATNPTYASSTTRPAILARACKRGVASAG